MFYDIFVKLCQQRGVSPSKAAEDAGLSRTSVVKWKNGSTPSGATAQKIAAYFNVSVNYLLGTPQDGADIGKIIGLISEDFDIGYKEALEIMQSFTEEWRTTRNARGLYDCFRLYFAERGIQKKEKPTLTRKDERSVIQPTDADIKFALFGKTDIDDETYESVKEFAKFAAEQKRKKREGK